MKKTFSIFDVLKSFIILQSAEAKIEAKAESPIYPGCSAISVNNLNEFNYRDLGSGQYELKTFFGKQIISKETYSLKEIRQLAICWLAGSRLPIKP
jgi:hypothetical protein